MEPTSQTKVPMCPLSTQPQVFSTSATRIALSVCLEHENDPSWAEGSEASIPALHAKMPDSCSGPEGHGHCPQGAWDGDGKGGDQHCPHSSGVVGYTGPGPPPLPPPASWFQQVAWKMLELRAPPAPRNGPTSIIGADGPRFVYIWQSKVPRSTRGPAPAPSRHFSFLRFPFTLSFAFRSRPRFTRQFLVDSLPTAVLPVRHWAQGQALLWHCRQPITPGVSSSPGHSHRVSLGAVWAA